jgi:hypothetical protein
MIIFNIKDIIMTNENIVDPNKNLKAILATNTLLLVDTHSNGMVLKVLPSDGKHIVQDISSTWWFMMENGASLAESKVITDKLLEECEFGKPLESAMVHNEAAIIEELQTGELTMKQIQDMVDKSNICKVTLAKIVVNTAMQNMVLREADEYVRLCHKDGQ